MNVTITVNLPEGKEYDYSFQLDGHNNLLGAINRLINSAVDLHHNWTSMVVTIGKGESKMSDKLKFIDIRAGDTLIAGGNFCCIKEGAALQVITHQDDSETIAVPCSLGHHILEGQVDEKGYVVGFTKENGNG